MKTKEIFFGVFFCLLFWPLLAKANKPQLEYNQGHKEHLLPVYLSAENCTTQPCVIGKYGTIKISEELQKNHEIELAFLQEEQYQSFALFQEGSNRNEKLFERLLNQRQNKKIFNLEQAIQTGQTNIIHLYGILLHYHLQEGDIIAINFTSYKNRKDKFSYYFRYHRKGPIFDTDVALINPINYFYPNNGDTVRYASISMALSFSVGWYMDPEKDYNYAQKFLHAWRLNLFGGLLRRHELTFVNNDQIVDAQFDGFVGAGFTFVDFFIGGAGINLARSPHSVFPFVGIEVKHLYQFMKSLKSSTKKKWNRYLEVQEKLNTSEN